MHDLAGVTNPTHVLPFSIAFVGAVVCFVAWVALMIRSQRREPIAGRSTGKPNTDAGWQRTRSLVGGRATAWLFLSGSAESGPHESYPLPMPYVVAPHGTAQRVAALSETGQSGALRAAPLRNVA
jgi:hypothetical protein